MHITAAMIEAARRAEYDYYQKDRQLGAGRFIPTPEPVIRAMLEAGLKLAAGEIAETEPAPQAQPRRCRTRQCARRAASSPLA